MDKLRSFLQKTIEIIKRPEMRILPGQLAFFFVLSLIPLLALIGIIASMFSVSIVTLTKNLIQALPTDISKFYVNTISGKGFNFNIAVFFISAFILASNGTHSMIIASNEIYKIKNTHYLKRRFKAVLMTVILVLILAFLLLVPVFGNSIFTYLLEKSNSSNIVLLIYKIYKILKIPLSLFLVYFSVKLLYVLAPDTKIESKQTSFGALFTTVSWIIVTQIYSFYIGTFSSYNIFYGSISNILILMLWVYFLSYIFVIGMAFNAYNYKKST